MTTPGGLPSTAAVEATPPGRVGLWGYGWVRASRGAGMERTPLFSTYRGGENRVTSSILAVLQRVDLHLVGRLLGAASGESTIGLVTFTNQVAGGTASSVPDGAIAANFRYLFEVKTDRNAIRADQLRAHLAHLDGQHDDERLFVLTPDADTPSAIASLDDDRLTWMSFAGLHDAIDDVLVDPLELVGERTEFLLRELQALFQAEGLLGGVDVVVVAAREAYPEYLRTGAYVCQPGRAFTGGLTHLGFYTKGAIQPEIPQIIHREEAVVFSGPEADRRRAQAGYGPALAKIIEALLNNGSRSDGTAYQVFLLTRPNDPATVRLDQPVQNAARTTTGRTIAWTRGQRYTKMEHLRANPTTTDELDAASS